jgi:hypothetical protein
MTDGEMVTVGVPLRFQNYQDKHGIHSKHPSCKSTFVLSTDHTFCATSCLVTCLGRNSAADLACDRFSTEKRLLQLQTLLSIK